MKKTRFVFVILVYKNFNDLVNLINNIREMEKECEIVLVNSFYDNDSSKQVSLISKDYGCHFLNVENKGYGFGNNKGIEYANINFDYKFIIISNPDVIIEKFDTREIDDSRCIVIGPIIKTTKRKSQNPYWVHQNKLSEYLIYKGYKKSIRLPIILGTIINKIIREIYLLFFHISGKKYGKVFALHGSFVVIHRNIIEKIGKLYDENMFLFSEEAYIAHALKDVGIESYIYKGIVVKHMEDGSINLSNINEKSEIRKSVVYYYEKKVLRR